MWRAAGQACGAVWVSASWEGPRSGSGELASTTVSPADADAARTVLCRSCFVQGEASAVVDAGRGGTKVGLVP